METSVSILTAQAAQVCANFPHAGSEKPDIRGLIGFWRQNKYPLLALNCDNGLREFLSSPEFKVARDKEEHLFGSLREEYILVRDRWARAGIGCILIKSGGLVPSFPYLSDNLDVLVKEENEEKARTILKESGYVELRNIEEPKKFLFRKFIGGECVSAIHLHTQVGWLVGFMDEDALWEKSRVSPDDEKIAIPSPEDVILINVAHSFYENKKFRLADIVRIRECWCQGGIDWGYMERVAARRGWLNGLRFCILVYASLEKNLWVGESSVPQLLLEDCQDSLKSRPFIYRYYRRIMRHSSISLPFTFSFAFSKLLYYEKVLHDRQHNLGTRLYNVIQTFAIGIKLKSGIRPRPSLLVSFSGPDGSGKTVLAQVLVKTLATCELKAKYYWTRCGTSGTARAFSGLGKILFSNRFDMAATKPGAAGRRERLQNPLLRLFWSYLSAADMIFTYFFQVRLPLFFGKIVICDRYIFDAAAEMACALSPKDRLNRLAIKLMLALVPKPDVAYLLDIPEDICAQRKNDNTGVDYLRRQRGAYLELAGRYHLRIKKTDREFSLTANEITREVLPPYLDNFETFLNGLFLANSSQFNKPGGRG